MLHELHTTSVSRNSSLVAIAGADGYIGQILCHELQLAGIVYFKIPNFRKLSPSSIAEQTPPARLMLINCSGTPPGRKEISFEVMLEDNVQSLEKLIAAYKSRLDAVLQISTSLLNNVTRHSIYTDSKQLAERYLENSSLRYGFSIHVLRLPTIWSYVLLKENSLLSEIVRSLPRKDFSNFQQLDSQIQIAGQRSFGVEIIKYIKGESLDIKFDKYNSWSGDVKSLLRMLSQNYVEGVGAENNLELLDIVNFWLSHPPHS